MFGIYIFTILGIVLFVGGAIFLFVLSPEYHHDIGTLWPFIIMAVIGAIILGKAFFFGPEHYEETYSEKIQLVAGKDTLTTEGSFILGCGSVSTDYQIRYLARDEDGELAISTSAIDAIDDSLPSGEQPYLEKRYNVDKWRFSEDRQWIWTQFMVDNIDSGYEMELAKTVLHISQSSLDKTVVIDLE